MTGLMVEPSALSAYAAQLARARDDCQVISDYVVKHATDGTGGEMFAVAREGNQHAVENIRGTFYRLTCLLETSAPELQAAGRYYRTTDLRAAKDLDLALPPGGRMCPTTLEYELANNPCKPPLFGDSRVPESHLVPPPKEPDNPVNKWG